jgi:phage host-nuclease inhibitor protein Gam
MLRLSRCHARHAAVLAEMEAEMEVVRQRYATRLRSLEDAISRDDTAVRAYCEAERGVLTDGGRVRVVHVAPGLAVSWRAGRPSVVADNEDETLAVLERLGLDACIRVARSLNRQAILANPVLIEGVPGIRIERREMLELTFNLSEVKRDGTPAGKPGAASAS